MGTYDIYDEYGKMLSYTNWPVSGSHQALGEEEVEIFVDSIMQFLLQY